MWGVMPNGVEENQGVGPFTDGDELNRMDVLSPSS